LSVRKFQILVASSTRHLFGSWVDMTPQLVVPDEYARNSLSHDELYPYLDLLHSTKQCNVTNCENLATRIITRYLFMSYHMKRHNVVNPSCYILHNYLISLQNYRSQSRLKNFFENTVRLPWKATRYSVGLDPRYINTASSSSHFTATSCDINKNPALWPQCGVIHSKTFFS